MTEKTTFSSAADAASASIDAAVRKAEDALAALKSALNSEHAGEIGDKISAAAAALLREGEQLLAQNETLNKAQKDLSGAVRRNPLGAIAVAFGAGLLIALLT